jgi:hypothetical protein
VSGQLHAPVTSLLRKEAPVPALNDMEKLKFLTLLGLELRPFSRPARRQTLYRPRYRGSYISTDCMFIFSVEYFENVVLVLVNGARGSVVVKVLCYKPEGRGSIPNEVNF